jgi:hypothetical protein
MAKKSETQKPVKVQKVTRTAAANRVVAELKAGSKTTLAELAAKADSIVVASGGTSKMLDSTFYVRKALEAGEAFGLLRLQRPTDVQVERL